MKLRLERSGYHFFDRVSGLHILFDERRPSGTAVSRAPRVLSIALWNVCDLRCGFCYRPRNTDRLAGEFVRELAMAADELGCLELTFGGGEPLAYPSIADLCGWIWDHTSLGLSLTTHGHRLDESMIGALSGHLSIIRVSIDGVEPYYSSVRGRRLEDLMAKIRIVRDAIPFGINTVVSPHHVDQLPAVLELAVGIGASNVLVLPELTHGEVRLSAAELEATIEIIEDFRQRIEIYVPPWLGDHLQTRLLDTEASDEFTFAHVSASRELRLSSHAGGGVEIMDPSRLGEYLDRLNCVSGVAS